MVCIVVMIFFCIHIMHMPCFAFDFFNLRFRFKIRAPFVHVVSKSCCLVLFMHVTHMICGCEVYKPMSKLCTIFIINLSHVKFLMMHPTTLMGRIYTIIIKITCITTPQSIGQNYLTYYNKLLQIRKY